MSSKYLILLIVALVLMLYTQYYMNYSRGYKIIQSPLSNLSIDTLFERQPIVISDRIVEPLHLTTTLFKWSYLTKEKHDVHPNVSVVRTCHKFCILTSPADVTVNIVNPVYTKQLRPWSKATSDGLMKSALPLLDSNVQYVTIKLKKQQCLIMPMHWMYECTSPHTIILMDDIMTLIICHLINLFNGRTTASSTG